MVGVPRIVFGLAVFAAAALAGAIVIGTDSLTLAQSRPPPRPAAPPPAATPAPSTPEAQPAPAKPLRTEILNFDNWTLTCSEFAPKPAKRVCSAQLQVTQQNSNNVVLVWTIGLNEEHRPIAMLQTPTGVSIPPGVELKLGSAAPRKIPFATCEAARCSASTPLDSALVRDITAAANAEVVVYAPNGTGVQFSFPLKGFDKAYAEMAR